MHWASVSESYSSMFNIELQMYVCRVCCILHIVCTSSLCLHRTVIVQRSPQTTEPSKLINSVGHLIENLEKEQNQTEHRQVKLLGLLNVTVQEDTDNINAV